MKHFISLFLLAFLLFGCSNDDNSHDYHLEYVNVISADLPDEFIYGYTYRINVTIELPNSCYYFYNHKCYNFIFDNVSEYASLR